MKIRVYAFGMTTGLGTTLDAFLRSLENPTNTSKLIGNLYRLIKVHRLGDAVAGLVITHKRLFQNTGIGR